MDDQEDDGVFRAAGFALYRAQCLEAEVCNLLLYGSLLRNRAMTDAERDRLLERAERKTLGRLLDEVAVQGSVPPTLADDLTEALRHRNFLAHRFFLERSNEAIVQGGPERVLQELRDMAVLFHRVDVALQAVMRDTIRGFGHSSADLNAALDEAYEGSPPVCFDDDFRLVRADQSDRGEDASV